MLFQWASEEGNVRSAETVNKKQRWVLFGCAAIIALMLLFPPFHTPRGPGRPAYNHGYDFLFSVSHDYSTVNTGTLFIQWVGVILVGGILWFAFRDKGQSGL